MSVYLVKKTFKIGWKSDVSIAEEYINNTVIVKCYKSERHALMVAYEHNVRKIYGDDDDNNNSDYKKCNLREFSDLSDIKYCALYKDQDGNNLKYDDCNEFNVSYLEWLLYKKINTDYGILHKNIMTELLSQTQRDYETYPKIKKELSNENIKHLLAESITKICDDMYDKYVDDYWEVIELKIH